MNFILQPDDRRELLRLWEYLEKLMPIHPQLVTVEDYEETRKLVQNSAYWAGVVRQVVQYLNMHCDRPTEAAVLHEKHKRLFQPVIGTFETTLELPDGQIIPYQQTVHKSTTKNTISQCYEFTRNVEVYWAKQGVRFVDLRYE